ncbi:MAG: hypothetical protein K9K37_00935 [Desulfocapsa sp.]|nr:hypothetical protein [Desulfocapsa sp.]
MGAMKVKYFHFKRTPLFYLGLVVILCLSAVPAHFVQSPYQGDCRIYEINIALETEEEAKLEIYYDIGRGFHEIDHQEVIVETTGEKVAIQMTVPVWKKFTKLRIDPVGGSVKMKIYGIEVNSADGTFHHAVSLADLTPVQQISNGHWNGKYYSFETPSDANDPMLLVVNIDDPQRQAAGKSLAVYALWIGAGFFGTIFCNWIFRFFILGL